MDIQECEGKDMGLLRWIQTAILRNNANALQSYVDDSKNTKNKMSLQKHKLDGSEKSMIPVIKTDAYLLLDGENSSQLKALEEFSAGTGISDITLFCIDNNLIQQRTKLDKSPLTSKAYIELILFVASNSKVKLEDIFNAFKGFYSPKTIKNYISTLENKHVLELKDGFYISQFNYSDLREQKVIAIEAKVKDWKSGIRQAMRYQEYADYSYLAIYESHIQNCLQNMDIFERLGLGLIGVSDDGVTVHLRARKSEYQQLENKILAFERFISVFDDRYDAFEVRNNLCRQT